MHWVVFLRHLTKLQTWRKKMVKSKDLIWDRNYSPSQGRLIYLIRKRSKRQTRGTGMSWIGSKRQPASFCCRQVQTRNSGGSSSRWSQPGSLVWHQSEPDWRFPPPFATKKHTQCSPLFSIGIPLHQPAKPSVFGSADSALQPERDSL